MHATDAAGFVLAGGRSSRMGTDKALVEFRGQPLVAHALEILRGAGLSAAIAGAQPASQPVLRTFAPLVPDLEPDLGPLAGICAALASTNASWAIFVPVDLPLLPASLVVFLLQQTLTTGASITLCSVDGFVESFPVVLRRQLLPLLKSELQAGRGGCFAAFKAAAAKVGESISVLPVDLMVQSGQLADPRRLPASSWFMNLNSAEDLQRAESVLSTPSAS